MQACAARSALQGHMAKQVLILALNNAAFVYVPWLDVFLGYRLFMTQHDKSFGSMLADHIQIFQQLPFFQRSFQFIHSRVTLLSEV